MLSFRARFVASALSFSPLLAIRMVLIFMHNIINNNILTSSWKNLGLKIRKLMGRPSVTELY